MCRLRRLLGLTALKKKQDPVASVSQQRPSALEGPKQRVCFSRAVFGCVACHTGTLFGCVESCVAGVLIPPAGMWKKLLDGSEGEPCPWIHWLTR